MNKMFVTIPKDGYWLKEESIQKVEEKYGAKYMGYWAIRTTSGGWGDSPVDVFYQPNPDVSKGHTNYFGIFFRGDSSYICEASSAFSEPIYGIVDPLTNEVLVSKYRHDYVSKNDVMIDGGRDYIRRSTNGKLVEVKVNNDSFIINEQ